MQTYEEAVDFIDHIGKYGAHPGVENSARLLKALGHPERGLRIVHVAGTNGKGSVCAFLADMLSAQGFRTGLFTSPHLVEIRERIQLDREKIGKAEFAACFDMVQGAVEALAKDGYTGITYFDYLFAMALCWYRQQAADYVVLETGLGGRMDSTNAVSAPLLTVITSISLDHTEILGDTIAKIATEKAGIIKPGVPLIYCADEKEACEVIARTAKEKGAPRVGIGRKNCREIAGAYGSDAPHPLEFSFCLSGKESAALWGESLSHALLSSQRSESAALCGGSLGDGSPKNGICETLTVNSPALYQAENAAIAYTAALWVYLLDRSSSSIPEALRATLRRALSRSVWEGRFEEVLPNVYLDGAHNADGIRMLLASMRKIAANRPLTLLFTAVKEKDTAEMIREVCESGLFCRYLVTTVGGARAISPEELKAHFLAHTDLPVTAYDSPEEAFAAGLAGLKQWEGILLCAGSLYLVGIIKALLAGA